MTTANAMITDLNALPNLSEEDVATMLDKYEDELEGRIPSKVQGVLIIKFFDNSVIRFEFFDNEIVYQEGIWEVNVKPTLN